MGGNITKHDTLGWLSPAGRFYECLYGEHGIKATEIVRKEINPTYEHPSLYDIRDDGSIPPDAEQILEIRGWLKKTETDWWFWGDRTCRKYKVKTPEITQGQIDYLFDWCVNNKIEYPPRNLRNELSK